MPSPSTRATAVVLTIAAFLQATSSCARPFVEPARNGGVAVRSARIGWYTKKVVTKRAPETLLAEDGTICRVSPDRFEATASGSAVLCNWQ
jgi:hypothetical protein